MNDEQKEHVITAHSQSFPIVHLLELKMELKDAFIKAASEPAFFFSAIVPFFIDDAKSQVFVWRSTDEANKARVFFPSRCKGLSSFPSILTLDAISRGLDFVNKIWIKDVEFVALDYFRWGIVMVVMGLIVFVPFIP